METEIYDRFLKQCREKIGAIPRDFSWFQRKTYLNVRKPSWCGRDDKLSTFFQEREALLTGGLVVWGHVVQANMLLFNPGPDNCPGEVVYPLEVKKPCDVEELSRVARRLYDLKGTTPGEPKARRIAKHLTDEHTRQFGAPVPENISPDFPCGLSTVFFYRRHLPDRQLKSPLMPLLLNPKPPFVAMPLPEKFWPETLVEWWRM